MSVYTKVSDFISPVPMQTSLRTISEAQSSQYSLMNELIGIEDLEEKMKRLKIALERDSVKFINEWDLESIINVNLIMEVVKKVDRFKSLKLRLVNRFLNPELFGILAEKYVGELSIVFTKNEFQREFAFNNITQFMMNSKTLTKLSLENFTLTTIFESTNLRELTVGPRAKRESIHTIDFDKFPNLLKLSVMGEINIILPKNKHPLRKLLLNYSEINSLSGDPQNLPNLEMFKAKFDYRNEKAKYYNQLVDMVLENDGELDLTDVDYSWNYFKPGDKLKKLTISFGNFSRCASVEFVFPSCENIDLKDVDYGISLGNLPKNLKTLTLRNILHFKDDLPSLESLTIYSRGDDNFNMNKIKCPMTIHYPDGYENRPCMFGKITHPVKIIADAVRVTTDEENLKFIDAGKKLASRRFIDNNYYFSSKKGTECLHTFYGESLRITRQDIDNGWTFHPDLTELELDLCTITDFFPLSQFKTIKLINSNSETIEKVKKYSGPIKFLFGR
jgi:hypothetical protein